MPAKPKPKPKRRRTVLTVVGQDGEWLITRDSRGRRVTIAAALVDRHRDGTATYGDDTEVRFWR